LVYNCELVFFVKIAGNHASFLPVRQANKAGATGISLLLLAKLTIESRLGRPSKRRRKSGHPSWLFHDLERFISLPAVCGAVFIGNS
jgi:hypothetical protein